MLLEDVIKNTPDNHADKANLDEALQQIESVAWHINDQLREHENALKMLDIQRSLQGCFPKILIPGRRLLKQGNLMKVPRAGGSGHPRYFVLFSDMLMYCKIKIAGVEKLHLPKTNSLECGCMMPLKHTTVEALVGKGVFKVSCKSEELILYSQDGSNTSESWVDAITEAAKNHKRDAATLRKESSKREPIRRPELLKMRRESLSQILMNNSKHKMALREKKGGDGNGVGVTLSPRRMLFSSPRKKKRGDEKEAEESPSKMRRKGKEEGQEEEEGTPTRHSQRIAARMDKENRDKKATSMGPPAQIESVRKRTLKINRPSWKALSLTRKDRLKEEESLPSSALFRSPSIYDQQQQQQDGEVPSSSFMSSYLSGKICPLTPSQRQTDITHLVNQELKEKFNSPPSSASSASPSAAATSSNDGGGGVEEGGALVRAGYFYSPSKSFCGIM